MGLLRRSQTNETVPAGKEYEAFDEDGPGKLYLVRFRVNATTIFGDLQIDGQTIRCDVANLPTDENMDIYAPYTWWYSRYQGAPTNKFMLNFQAPGGLPFEERVTLTLRSSGATDTTLEHAELVIWQDAKEVDDDELTGGYDDGL